METFQTVKEFNKQYNQVRSDILERHGIKDGQKARLKDAIMLYQNFDGTWIKTTSKKTDMIDRIKMQEKVIKKGTEFKLVAMV
mgnify:CR=1 FL=1